MKSSKLRKSEAGQLLVYVTIVLMLAGLIIPPLLGFVSGAGRTAQIRQDRMLHVYAADAGMEDAFYRIGNSTAGLPQTPDAPPWVGNILDVNGYYVAVEIYKEAEEGVYRITSTATSDSGVSVTIEAYTSLWDYWSLLGNACSSLGDIDLSPNSEIYGNVTLDGNVTGSGDIYGDTTYGGILGWPSEEEGELSKFYDGQVVSLSCGYSTLSVGEDESIPLGPCQTAGDLIIKGKGNVTLGGTVYISGDLTVKPGITIKLQGETIFAEGTIEFQPGSFIYGPGVIIAVGDVHFAPNLGNSEFIFVMSVDGTVTAQPGGDFYGSFAGNIEIDLQPGVIIEWIEPPLGLNFFGGSPLVRIETYTIK